MTLDLPRALFAVAVLCSVAAAQPPAVRVIEPAYSHVLERVPKDEPGVHEVSEDGDLLLVAIARVPRSRGDAHSDHARAWLKARRMLAEELEPGRLRARAERRLQSGEGPAADPRILRELISRLDVRTSLVGVLTIAAWEADGTIMGAVGTSRAHLQALAKVERAKEPVLVEVSGFASVLAGDREGALDRAEAEARRRALERTCSQIVSAVDVRVVGSGGSRFSSCESVALNGALTWERVAERWEGNRVEVRIRATVHPRAGDGLSLAEAIAQMGDPKLMVLLDETLDGERVPTEPMSAEIEARLLQLGFDVPSRDVTLLARREAYRAHGYDLFGEGPRLEDPRGRALLREVLRLGGADLLVIGSFAAETGRDGLRAELVLRVVEASTGQISFAGQTSERVGLRDRPAMMAEMIRKLATARGDDSVLASLRGRLTEVWNRTLERGRRLSVRVHRCPDFGYAREVARLVRALPLTASLTNATSFDGKLGLFEFDVLWRGKPLSFVQLFEDQREFDVRFERLGGLRVSFSGSSFDFTVVGDGR